jgi:tetratricopeptide (TPR) repeat protein
LFSQGFRLKEQGEYEAGEGLLRQAIAEDPDFASAHLWLAYALWNQRRPEEEYLPHLERALALSETVSEPEREFIRGSYFLFRGQLEQAAAAYEALLSLQPDHIFAVANLGYVSFRLGRLERGVQLTLRAADLRPRNLVNNVRAAWYQIHYGGESALADTYIHRARALTTPQNEKRYPRFTAWLALHPAYEHWLRGDVQQTLEVTSRVAQTLPSRGGQERHIYSLSYVVGAWMALGRFNAAEAEIRGYPEPARSWGLANMAFVRGDTQGFLEMMRTAGPSERFHRSYISGILLARAGSLSKAQEEIPSAFASASQTLSLPVAEARANHLRGEIALARGEIDKAIELLEESIDHLGRTSWWVTGFFLAADALARAWEQQGNLERALQVLEQAAEAKTRIYSPFDGMWPAVTWTGIQFQRAQLLRKLGREKEAQQIEAELRQLLALADPDLDLPILRALKSREELAATAAPAGP